MIDFVVVAILSLISLKNLVNSILMMESPNNKRTFTSSYSVCSNDRDALMPNRHSNRSSYYTCVVDSNEEGEREFPMFMAMADLTITPTGFPDIVLREALCTKIRLMCGEVSMAYTNRTTHILAAHANTTKVDLAKERKLPVVTVDWIENIWNACQQLNNPYIHASLTQFKCCEFPTFFNLSFVFSSRYDEDSKEFYEDLLEQNGGYVMAFLKRGGSYFYICQEPENDRMYLYAQARQIPCVSLAWIMESVNRKSLAKISEYEIKGNALSEIGSTIATDNFFDLDILHHMPAYGYPGNNSLSYQPALQTVKKVRGVVFHDDDADGEADAPMGETSDSTVTPADNKTDGDIEMADASKMEHDLDESLLEQTVCEVDDDGKKDNLVDSLPFSMAG